MPERQLEAHFMEASPTLRQPLRLSCLRNPPHRFEMFSTTRPWKRDGHRGGHSHRIASAVMSRSAPRPSDPASGCMMVLKNRTWSWNYTPIYTYFALRNTVLTSISVWKLNKSIFCQLLPSRAKTFHAWEGDRQLAGTREALKFLY